MLAFCLHCKGKRALVQVDNLLIHEMIAFTVGQHSCILGEPHGAYSNGIERNKTHRASGSNTNQFAHAQTQRQRRVFNKL